MNKAIFMCFTLLALISISSQARSGGYMDVPLSGLSEFQNDQNFQTAQQMARDKYRETHNSNLGQLTSLSHQIVSGTNYKMVFESPEGPIQVVVYSQPWTNTYEILEMKPVVEQE